MLAALLMTLISTAAADMPSTHGMLVVGRNAVYLSHLPMFHSPHDYQLIVQAELGAMRDVFLADQAKHPEQTVYTLVPERFSLPDMVAHPKPFKATLYRGHFERGGTPIASGKALFVKVVHFHQLEPNATRPAEPREIVFGSPDDRYSAHEITARPDFDRVRSLTDGRELYFESGDLE